MASQLSDVDLPSGVQIARFMRLRLNVGFVGGQEKTIEYDTRKENNETGEIQYRTFIERNGEYPPEGVEDGDFQLQDVARHRVALKVFTEADVSYTEYAGQEEMYLVTWDFGRTIRIMDEEEASHILSAVVAQEDRLRSEDLSSLGGLSVEGYTESEPRSESDADAAVAEAPPEDDQPASVSEDEPVEPAESEVPETSTADEDGESVEAAPPSIEQ